MVRLKCPWCGNDVFNITIDRQIDWATAYCTTEGCNFHHTFVKVIKISSWQIRNIEEDLHRLEKYLKRARHHTDNHREMMHEHNGGKIHA